MILLSEDGDRVNLTLSPVASINAGDIPGAPPLHKIVVAISLTNLPAATRNLHVIVEEDALVGDAYVIFADFTVSVTTDGLDEITGITIGPFVAGTGGMILVSVSSDSAGDTAADVNCQLLSDDIEYALAFRAAEASPTALSPIARLKASSDTVAKVEKVLTVKT
jgi:hypothetical protein